MGAVTDRYEVEVLLRPPVELASSIVAFSSAVLAAFAPTLFLMTPSVGYVSATILSMLGFWRASQAWWIMRYQYYLKRSPRYSLSSRRIPVSQKFLFLGRGFRWTQTHTERLYAARDKRAERYVQAPSFIQWIRKKEIEWEGKRFLRYLTRLSAKDSALNPLRPPPPVGGDPLIHGVGGGAETNVVMRLTERAGHLVVIARTRHGKTRLAEILTTQDIHRHNNCVIVLDPKGDADYLKRIYIEAKRAGRRLIIFHLGHPELSAQYNAIGSFSRITEVATRIATQLPSEGDAAAFREFAWLFINIIAVTLDALGEEQDYQKVRRYINDIDPLLIRYAQHWLNSHGAETWQIAVSEIYDSLNLKALSRADQGKDPHAIALVRYLKEEGGYDHILEGLLSMFRYDREYYQKITVAVKPFLEKLTTGKISRILSPSILESDTTKKDISTIERLEWLDAIQSDAVVYVGLDALTDPEIAEAFGEAMFSDLTSLAGFIYKSGDKKNVIIHADEFSDLIGPQFKTLINKSGGAGYQLNLYTQTWSDPIAELGSEAQAGQLAGNIGTTIMMGVKEINTCEMFTKQLPTVSVSEIMAVSGVTDDTDGDGIVNFTSNNQDRISISREPMISPADIVALPKGQAFVLLNGSELWKIRIPMPSRLDDDGLPDNLAAMLAEMRRNYKPVLDWQGYHRHR